MAGNYSLLANCLVAQLPQWDFIATTCWNVSRSDRQHPVQGAPPVGHADWRAVIAVLETMKAHRVALRRARISR